MKPPYAKRAIKHGTVSSVIVRAGDQAAWRMAQFDGHYNSLVAPSNTDPRDFDWSLIQGRDVIVTQHGDASPGFLELLAHTLIDAGASLVVVLPEPDREAIIYRPDDE